MQRSENALAYAERLFKLHTRIATGAHVQVEDPKVMQFRRGRRGVASSNLATNCQCLEQQRQSRNNISDIRVHERKVVANCGTDRSLRMELRDLQRLLEQRNRILPAAFRPTQHPEIS
jgi:hypothetical protein